MKRDELLTHKTLMNHKRIVQRSQIHKQVFNYFIYIYINLINANKSSKSKMNGCVEQVRRGIIKGFRKVGFTGANVY